MAKASKLLGILIATLFANHVSSQSQPPTKPNFFFRSCQSSYGNYTANSPYETNLKTVLSTLQEHASLEGFYNTSAGSGTETAYGQYYCRGDVDAAFCSQCIQQAAEAVFKNCTGVKSAVIWYQECTLRFRNQSMFGIAEPPLSGSYGSNPANVSSDPVTFFGVLNATMSSLVQKAAYGMRDREFATGEGEVSAFETVYCLVQCSPDLNGTQCETCLVDTLSFLKTCCGKWSVAVYAFNPDCEMMYSTLGRFYLTQNAPPPPKSVSQPPPPPPTVNQSSTSPPTTGGSAVVRRFESLMIGMLIATLVFMMLVLYI